MVFALDALLLFLLLPWIWRALFLARLLLAALGSSAKVPTESLGKQMRPPKFVIIVPAHNEELGLAKTLDSLKQLDYPESRWSCLVVADNCNDKTAFIAKASGVDVIERHNDKLRGKGYALEFAIDDLIHRDVQPDAIVIIDADTLVKSDLLQVFAAYLQADACWIQAYYSVANADESWRSQLLSYALSLFNGVWLMGQDRLGLGSALRGNGMCFRWQALNRCPLRAYGLAEDLEYSWHLRLAGEHVEFAANAQVFGEMPTGGQAAASQRQRWESGRRALRKEFWRPIWQDKQTGLLKRLDLLSDLYMWPLSRFFVATLATGLLLLVRSQFLELSLLTGLMWSLFIITILNISIYALSPFRLLGLPLSRAKALIYIPAYILWKLWLLAKPAPKTWKRTPRAGE